MTTITIAIALGNDTMQTGDDVAGALRALADHYARYGTQPLRHPWTPPHTIRDANGNTVGGATVSDDDVPDDDEAPACAECAAQGCTQYLPCPAHP